MIVYWSVLECAGVLESWSVLEYWSVLGCRSVHNFELGVENPFLPSPGGGGKTFLPSPGGVENPFLPLLVKVGMDFPPPAQKIPWKCTLEWE